MRAYKHSNQRKAKKKSRTSGWYPCKHSHFVFKSSNPECIKRKHIVVDDMIQNPKHIVCIYTSSNKELTKTTKYWTSSRCSTPETWPKWELAPASRDNHHCAMLFCHHQTAARRSSALAAPACDLDDRKHRSWTKRLVRRNEEKQSNLIGKSRSI